MSLQNTVAIVTGASRGIGAGIATELARRGANVLITYVASADKAEQLVQEINSNQSGTGAKAACVRANCVHPDAPREVVQAAIKAFDGRIDIIVNNAGAGDEMFLKDATYEHFDKMFHTNVRFPMFLVKESLPYLRRGGRIVNVGSVVARQGWKMHTAYGATKACMESFARTWAVELGHDYGVTVNNVNPGPVATDMWDAMPPEALTGMDGYIQATPAAPRVGTVDDVTQIVAFLCEEGARWVTGSTTCANGGAEFV